MGWRKKEHSRKLRVFSLFSARRRPQWIGVSIINEGGGGITERRVYRKVGDSVPMPQLMMTIRVRGPVKKDPNSTSECFTWLAMLGFVSVGYTPKRQTFVSVTNMWTMSAQHVGNILLGWPIFLPTKPCQGIVSSTHFSTCR